MKNPKVFAYCFGASALMTWVGAFGLLSWEEALSPSAIVICLVVGVVFGTILYKNRD